MSTSKRATDWSQLHRDLLEKISGNIDEIADRARFGAVCKSWRSASKATHLPRVRLPWLLLEDPDRVPWFLGEEREDDGRRRYFSLSHNKIYTIHLPENSKKLYYGSPHGWLLSVDDSGSSLIVSLLNPITKGQIFLPPLAADYFYHCKLIATSEVLVAMLAADGGRLIYSYHQRKVVDDKASSGWNIIIVKDSNGRVTGIGDITYYGGLYFVLGETEIGTMVFDANRPINNRLTSVIPSVLTDRPYHRSYKYHRRFLAESSSGDKLFLVVSPSRTRQAMFEVFELNQTEQQARWNWSKVRSIGCNVLFVDEEHAMVLPASGFHGCRGNCIVFFCYDEDSPPSHTCGEEIGGFSLFDIGNDEVEQLPSSWHECIKGWANKGWFVPSL